MMKVILAVFALALCLQLAAAGTRPAPPAMMVPNRFLAVRLSSLISRLPLLLHYAKLLMSQRGPQLETAN
jgi:hypothetical protein